MAENIINNSPQISDSEKQELMRSLLHKEGCWVDWGKKCQQLQKAGVDAQEIFERTGLQNSQQNLVIVASQVYDSLVKTEVEESTLKYYQGPRSDVLYELRVLNHQDRKEAALYCEQKKLDVDGAKEVAKNMKLFARISHPPEGFTTHPGDTVAYQLWRSAKQKKTLSDKTRLIAEGLKYAHSEGARNKIQQLLTDVATAQTVSSTPLLPVYRLEAEEQIPCILPVVGTFPLTSSPFDNIPVLSPQEPFDIVEVSQTMSLVSIPTWQVVLQAKKPVVIKAHTHDLPQQQDEKNEPVLVVVDAHNTEWSSQYYFLVNHGGEIKFSWLPTQGEEEILGRLLVILKARRILDENNLTEPWQMDD
ncbi:MAG: RuBisCO accumulation factor 1 [Cyanobacterium sp.]